MRNAAEIELDRLIMERFNLPGKRIGNWEIRKDDIPAERTPKIPRGSGLPIVGPGGEI